MVFSSCFHGPVSAQRPEVGSKSRSSKTSPITSQGRSLRSGKGEEKPWKIMENRGKSSENHQKSWKILENCGKILENCGKIMENCGTSRFFMGKLTNFQWACSMAMLTYQRTEGNKHTAMWGIPLRKPIRKMVWDHPINIGPEKSTFRLPTYSPKLCSTRPTFQTCGWAITNDSPEIGMINRAKLRCMRWFSTRRIFGFSSSIIVEH